MKNNFFKLKFTEIVKYFLFQKGDCNQKEIKIIKELESILKCKDVSLASMIKVIHTVVFSITIYECESWTVTKVGRKKMD